MLRKSSLFFICLFLFNFSCEASGTKIGNVVFELNHFYDLSTKHEYEFLNFYVSVRPLNSDDVLAIESIKEVHIVNEAQQIYWVLDYSSWEVVSKDIDLWIGHPKLVNPNLRSIPRGDYKVFVIRTNKQITETKFTLGDAPFKFFEEDEIIKVEGDKIIFPEKFKSKSLFLYNLQDVFLDKIDMVNPFIFFENIVKISEEAITAYFYTRNMSTGVKVKQGPILIKTNNSQ